MTISEEFLWHFKDVINYASRIYCPKISLNECTDLDLKNTINVGSYELWLIFHHRDETFYWKKIEKWK